MFEFKDRVGNTERLEPHHGESIDALLLRYNIPPASALVMRDGVPVVDSHRIEPDANYVAALIEGYDIGSIRAFYAAEAAPKSEGAYEKRRLNFLRAGSVQTERASLTLEETAALVDGTVLETCTEFELAEPGDSVLVGLSGGVDSSSLAVALSRARQTLPQFRLAAVTFEDYDSKESPTYVHASALAEQLGLEHHIAPATMAEEVFHLNTPLRKILPALMRTESAHFAMYVDHHTTRRALEVFAERNGFNKIALGLHTTDLIAGLLNGWMTGYNVADIPARTIGHHRYIYPLAFVNKRELHLYHYHRTGQLVRHAHVNGWERNPLDRNFYYYLADRLQSIWPGIETMLFPAHIQRLRGRAELRHEYCDNCGAAVIHQPFTSLESSECDVCCLLRKHGYVHRKLS